MQDLARLPYPIQVQIIRVLLPKMKTTQLTVKMKLKIVAVTGCDLGNKQHAGRSVIEFEKHVAVVIQRPACNHGGEVRTNLRHLMAAHIFEEIERMGADVTDCSSQT